MITLGFSNWIGSSTITDQPLPAYALYPFVLEYPSLLPKFPGLHAIHDALVAKEKESGMTIHIIDEGLDTGPKLVQKSCSISETDTEETLKEKIQALEKEWYPKVLQMIESGEMTLLS
jgi:phosphoribosylglycinamide formyltransferase-1